jgi:LmbE family N-acetylglucosaminyl deacetylase
MKTRNLIVVAHPDDEVIFFGGLILQLISEGSRVDVICATGKFHPPHMTSIRLAEFRRACWRMGARAHILGLAETRGPCQLDEITARLQIIKDRYTQDSVYTHGIWGEYGHIYHRSVCLAAHRVFGDCVFSLAGPLCAGYTIELTPAAFVRKRRLAASVYYSQPFASEWCSSEERFAQVSCSCVESLFSIENHKSGISSANDLSDFAFQDIVRKSIAAFRSNDVPFPEVAYIPPPFWRPRHREFLRSLQSLVANTRAR